jgi:hypothetical protein
MICEEESIHSPLYIGDNILNVTLFSSVLGKLEVTVNNRPHRLICRILRGIVREYLDYPKIRDLMRMMKIRLP